MQRRLMILSCLALGMGLVGCGGGAGGEQSTFSLTGKLYVDDQPTGPATLTFSSTDPSGKGVSMTGNVKQDGTITFVTYGREGAAAGTYRVTLAGSIMSAAKVPATKPIDIEIKSTDKNVDVKFTSIPGAAPVGGLAPIAPAP